MNFPLASVALNSDIAGSSAGGYPRHAELGRAAALLITQAIQKSDAPEIWTRSSRGDGEVTLAPAAVPPAWLLREFLDTLWAGALEYNRNKRHDDSEDHRLRLRIGIAGGDVLIEDGEPKAGDPLVLAQRLQGSRAARQALEALDHVPLVAVIADDVYQRVVPHQANGFHRDHFRAVRVDVNGTAVDAWLYVPHTYAPHVDDAVFSQPEVAPQTASASPPPTSSAPAAPGASKYSVPITNSENIQVGDQPRMWTNP